MYDKNGSTELDCNFLLFCKPFLVKFRLLLPLVAAKVNTHEEGIGMRFLFSASLAAAAIIARGCKLQPKKHATAIKEVGNQCKWAAERVNNEDNL